MAHMSSMEIAQITAAYNQMALQTGTMRPVSMAADQAMGGAMSRVGGMAGPMMQGVGAMMGFDPFSMGLKAAGGAWGAGGGVLGAGMAGLGAAGMTAGIGAGVGFVGQQMFQGAQNRMSFNNSMATSFNFMRPDAQGQGFNRPDLNAISGTLQSMTHQYGPGGEASSFGELARLASNMGRMGLTTGVRDAQEFSKKFKEMVSTLKTVATELGTSLESAQELLSSARGSGIFKATDQLKFSGLMRKTGLAGGLATSEMTAMANIGSRVSRSVGGLGTAGAFGGIKALGQVGTAQQIGAISEEDIYNATGLTGAEGRQAYATEMLQNTGNFFRSAKGRFFLASVAGKDGKLNMNAVEDYMSGGVGTEKTRSLAQENLNGMGRANFIRNEGRLRGAAMEQFGAMAPAIALTGWAQQRGININDMDDKAMLFAQRQLGMGRDELDATIKIARNLPDIMREQRKVATDDEFTQGRAQSIKQRSLQTRLDHIKENIQGRIQSFGSSLFESGSDYIHGAMNRILDIYERRVSADVEEVAGKAKLGGAANREAYGRMLGGGMNFGEGAANAQGMGKGIFGSANYSAGDPAAMKNYLRMSALQGAAFSGQASSGNWATKNATLFAGEYASGGIASAQGLARVAKVESLLRERASGKDEEAAALLRQLSGADEAGKVAIVADMERKAKIPTESGIGSTFTRGDFFAGGGGFRSTAEANKAIGEAFLGDRPGFATQAVSYLAYAGMAAKAFGGKGFLSGMGEMAHVFKEAPLPFANDKLNESVAETFRSASGRKLIASITTGGDKSAAMAEMIRLQAKNQRELSVEEKGRLAALQMTDIATQASAIEAGSGTPEEKAKRQAALVAKANKNDFLKGVVGGGITGSNIAQWQQAVSGTTYIQAVSDQKEVLDKIVKQGDESRETMQRLGIIEMKDVTGTTQEGEGWGGRKSQLFLSTATKDKLSKVQGGTQAAQLAIELTNAQRDLVNITDPEARQKAMMGIQATEANLYDKLANVKDQRAFASVMAGTQVGGMMRDVMGMQAKFSSLSTKGWQSGVAGYMGLNREDIAGKSDKEIEAYVGAKLKIGPESAQAADLHKAIAAAAKGGSDTGLQLERLMSSLTAEQRNVLKKQEDTAENDIADNTKRAAECLEAMVTSNEDARNSLRDIRNKWNQSTADNAETKGK